MKQAVKGRKRTLKGAAARFQYGSRMLEPRKSFFQQSVKNVSIAEHSRPSSRFIARALSVMNNTPCVASLDAPMKRF
jgi:hypothetical protein